MKLILATAVLAASASAQTFYLGTQKAHEAAAKIEGSSPNVIRGHLIQENDAVYSVRVEGGQVILPKAQVWKVEGVAIAVAQIEQREADARAELDQQNERRASVVAAEVRAARSRRNDVRAMEASMRKQAVDAAATRSSTLGGFDPVRGVFQGRSQANVVARLEALYEATRDPAVARAMRRARRAQ